MKQRRTIVVDPFSNRKAALPRTNKNYLVKILAEVTALALEKNEFRVFDVFELVESNRANGLSTLSDKTVPHLRIRIYPRFRATNSVSASKKDSNRNIFLVEHAQSEEINHGRFVRVTHICLNRG